TESDYIDDVIFFPLMKPAPVTKLQKEIYGEDALEGNENLLGRKSKVQDKTKKMAVVLNTDVSGWQVTNTVGHICAYLGSEIGKDNFATREVFELKDGTRIPANSQYPVVAVVANNNQLIT